MSPENAVPSPRRRVVPWTQAVALLALFLGALGFLPGPWPTWTGELHAACFLCRLAALPLTFVALLLSLHRRRGPLRIGAWALTVVVAGAYAALTLEEIRGI